MPTPDAMLLGHATSDYRLQFSLFSPRAFQVMDVDQFGDDTAAPPASDIAASVTVAEFDGITALGPLSGSVDGNGWTCPFAIARYPATFAAYYGVTIAGTAYYSNAPQPAVTLLRGYMQDVHPQRTAGSDLTQFVVATSHRFLQQSQLSYAIDWYTSASHLAPLALADAVRHFIFNHTNLTPRSGVTIALPAITLYQLSTSASDILSIIKGLAASALPEPWVFCRRDDQFVITSHPNLAGAAYPFPTPVLDFSDDMIYGIDPGPQERPDLVASVNLVAQTSYQDQLVSRYPTDGAPTATGSRLTLSGLRYDDQPSLDALAPLVYAHERRTWRNVTITAGIIFKADIGDLVTVTTTIPQRGIVWTAKRFVIRQIAYTINADQRTMITRYTLDEVTV